MDNLEFVGKCLYLNVGNIRNGSVGKIAEEKEVKGKKNAGGRRLGEKSKGMLVVGDLHLGYEESLNRSGVLVIRKMFSEMILYFDSVFDELKEREKEDGRERRIDEIVLLGDVKHGFGKGNKQEWNDVLELFDYLIKKMNEFSSVGTGLRYGREKKREKKIIVVRGNHDNYIKNIAGKRNVIVEDFYIVSGIGFCHGDKRIKEFDKKEIKMIVVGHGHPAVRLIDKKSGKEESYKCFLVGKWKVSLGGRRFGIGNVKGIIIVPSFIEYSEGTDARENDLGLGWDFELNKFNVKIVSEPDKLEVLDFGILGKL